MVDYLVTGGAGFIGSNLVNRLLNERNRVTVADNFSKGEKEFLQESDNLIVEDVDIRDKDELEETFKKADPDKVIHLAAVHFIPYCNDNPEETFDVNVMGTRNVFEACSEIEPETVFFASSAAVYPIREEANKEDSRLHPYDIYGRTKLIGEDLAQLYSEKEDFDVVAGRIFNVYGPHETNPHLIPEILEQVEKGKEEIQLGNFEPKRDYIYVKDVALAIINLVDQVQEYEVFNIGTGEEHSVKEVFEMIKNVTSKDLELKQDPEKVRDSDRMHLLADNTKLKQVTGWEPERNLETGLEEMIDEGSNG